MKPARITNSPNNCNLSGGKEITINWVEDRKIKMERRPRQGEREMDSERQRESGTHIEGVM